MYKPLLATFACLMFVAGCTEIQVGSHLVKKAVSTYSCKEEGDLKVGNPYRVDGITYTPMASSLAYREQGIASWYGEDFHGKATANGECYNMYAYTAAHKTLPLPTIVRVTNMENKKSIVVKVNDRGPFVRGRTIDLSYAAAESLGMARMGTAPVLVEAIGGPHHYVGGARGNTALAGRNLPPVGPQAETLPSYVPEEAVVEDLPPLNPPQKVETAFEAATPNPAEMAPLPPAEIAKLEAELPAPERQESLPLPPQKKTVPQTSSQPLAKTTVYVQTGAFSSSDNAERQLDSLRTLEDSAALSKVESGGMTLTRVRSGPYASIAEADEALERLVAAGFDSARLVVEAR